MKTKIIATVTLGAFLWYSSTLNSKCGLVGEYTMKRVAEVHGEWWRNERKNDQLPFTGEGKRYDDELCVNDIKVIINGHRYNLS